MCCLTGNLDRPGGAMFPLAAAGQANSAGGGRRPFTTGRWRSSVCGLPEVFGEIPVATLAEEILTPGEGRVRALITVGGNTCLSTPNAGRLAEALPQLDFMLSLDIYLNETIRRRALSARGSQHREVDPARAAEQTSAGVGDAAPADRHRHRPGPNADVAVLDEFVAE
jgi:hypothetical protein